MIVFSLVQSNADSPMLVTLFGIVTEVKLHNSNAWSPMLATPSGMMTEANPDQ